MVGRTDSIQHDVAFLRQRRRFGLFEQLFQRACPPSNSGTVIANSSRYNPQKPALPWRFRVCCLAFNGPAIENKYLDADLVRVTISVVTRTLTLTTNYYVDGPKERKPRE